MATAFIFIAEYQCVHVRTMITVSVYMEQSAVYCDDEQCSEGNLLMKFPAPNW